MSSAVVIPKLPSAPARDLGCRSSGPPVSGAAGSPAASTRLGGVMAPRAVVWVLSLPAVAYSALWVLTLLGRMGRWSWAGLLGWALVMVAVPGHQWWVRAVSRRGVEVASRADLALLGLTAPWGLTWWFMCALARRVPCGRVSLTVMPALVLGTAVAQSLAAGNVAGAVVMAAALHLVAVGPLLLRRLGAPTWEARVSP